MTEHTPGPWAMTVGRDGDGWLEDVTVSHGIVAVHHSNLGFGIDVNDNRVDNQIIANARLIAASPDLMAALENLMGQVSPPDPACRCHISPPCNDCVEWSATRDAMDQALAAIAKAKGVSL